MIRIFQRRWVNALLITAAAAIVSILLGGQLDLLLLLVIFLLSAVALSYPALLERVWQYKHLPPGTVHVPVKRVQKGNEILLLELFFLPEIYQLIRNRYRLKIGDPAAPGLFLYIHLPSPLYEMRNVGPETVYRELAERLKSDLQDASDVDVIAQRNLPLALGFRFLPKNQYRFHELSKIINITRKDYFRENTRIRGVLQSRRRMFRMHLPEDNEWRTFHPYLEDSQLLYGGSTLVHDFRASQQRKLAPHGVDEIDAERIEYPESIPFGSLLTYAKKGEISLAAAPAAVDKLYIDRINVLVNGPEHRREILAELTRRLGREVGEEDFYPLFNFAQKLRPFLEPGKSISDYVSSRGNFALYYDPEKGWTVLRLEPQLELHLEEAFWKKEPKNVAESVSLTTSRASISSGSPESLLQFQISTGTPTRGRIFAADELIENKMRTFAQANDFNLLKPVGTGAEGCVYLAGKNGRRFYIKSPDGRLAQEEMETIRELKTIGLIPAGIETYSDDRMIVLPEFSSFPHNNNGHHQTAHALVFEYLKQLWEHGYLCLDLTPDHLRIDAAERKVFFIDFSGYTTHDRFRRNHMELIADRKKIEYRTPEESLKSFEDAERFQIYLMGLLFYQLLHKDLLLPQALQTLNNGVKQYNSQLEADLKRLPEAQANYLKDMLAFQPRNRKTFEQLQPLFSLAPASVSEFWREMPAGAAVK